MAQSELIDSHVSLKQCKLAVNALHAHQSQKEQEQQESQLLPGKEQHIWLNVTVKKIPSGHKIKPVKIPIVHPLVDPRTTAICLITKDPQREYKDLLDTHKIKFISRVVGIEKLKGKFKPFDARRLLLKENGLFLADERIVPLLPKLLGVKWFEAKKQPIPVCLKRKDLKGELERAISSTYMNQNKGTCTSIKIGTLSQKPDQILANLKLALPAIAKHIKDGWDNIQALHIKTNSSASLPIWSCTLDEKEGGRWDGLTATADDEASSEGDDDEDEDEKMGDDVAETRKDTTRSNGRKRTQDSEESDKPQKKAKKTQDKIAPAPAAETSQIPAQMSAASPSLSNAKRTSSTLHKSKMAKMLKSDLPVSPIAVPQPSVDADDSDSPSANRVQESSKLSTTFTHKVQDSTSGLASKEKKAKKMDAGSKATRSSGPAHKTSPTIQVQSAPMSDKISAKKAKKDISSNPATTPSKPEPTSADEAPGKHEKTKTPAVASTAKPPRISSTSLTKDELKQKRAGGVVEKKKNKVKTMGSKSAKNAVLGKKVAQ